MSEPSTPEGVSTPEPSPTPDAPEAPEAPVAPETPEAPEAPETPEAPAEEETFAHTFNPHDLPPELQPRYHEMLADYTRKTQEVAEGRRQIAEAVGNADLSVLRDARELYEQLQDQTNWPQLYTHLQEALSESGMLEGDALRTPVESGVPQAPVDSAALEGDPELAPVMQQMQSLQQELAQLREERDAEREADRAYQEQVQRHAEFARQEAALMAANRHYKDEDLQEIRLMSAAFGGNRLQAQQAFELSRQRHVAAWVAAKQAVQTTTPAPAPGAEVTAVEAQDDFGSDVDAAYEAAKAELRAALGDA